VANNYKIMTVIGTILMNRESLIRGDTTMEGALLKSILGAVAQGCGSILVIGSARLWRLFLEMVLDRYPHTRLIAKGQKFGW
jgi:hypothetical protein